RDRDDGRGGAGRCRVRLERALAPPGRRAARRSLRRRRGGVLLVLSNERLLRARERVARPDKAVAVDAQALAALTPPGGAPAVAVARERRLLLPRQRPGHLRLQRFVAPGEDELVALRPPAPEERAHVVRRLALRLPRLDGGRPQLRGLFGEVDGKRLHV